MCNSNFVHIFGAGEFERRLRVVIYDILFAIFIKFSNWHRRKKKKIQKYRSMFETIMKWMKNGCWFWKRNVIGMMESYEKNLQSSNLKEKGLAMETHWINVNGMCRNISNIYSNELVQVSSVGFRFVILVLCARHKRSEIDNFFSSCSSLHFFLHI